MWLFELLLRLYPAGFRSEYGESMRVAARDELAESGWMVFTLRMVVDFALGWPEVVGSELRQDAVYCWRSWRKRTAMTVMAVLALGMALGISTGVFSVLNAMLYRSLPFREPEQLVLFTGYFAPVYKGQAVFAEWTKDHRFLSEAGVFSVNDFSLERRPGALRVKGAETTANFFQMLGTPLFLGRGFLPEEEVEGKGDVVVLSHALYEQAFGGDPRILGQMIRLNQHPMTVVGVAAPGFDFPQNAGLWMPTVFDFGRVPKTGVSSTISMGRIAEGMSLEQAQTAFLGVNERTRRMSYPKGVAEFKARMVSLREELAGPVSKAIWVLFGGVVVVLLIACANLSHLLLSRFAERGDELRIRSWLGAGEGRIRQQLMTECVLLALAAGAVGLGFAELTARIGAHYFPPLFAFQRYEVFDLRVLLFALAVALLCGFGFGMAPALMRWRLSGVRQVLLGSQVCLTAVLLVSSLTLGRGLVELYRLDIGFQTRGVETATVSLAGSVYQTPARQREYLERSLRAVQGIPGVRKVGAIDYMPLVANSFLAGLYEVQAKRDPEMALLLRMSPGLVEAMGGTLLAGRDFGPQDREGSEPVAIVSESFAKLNGGVRDALGRRLRLSEDVKSKEPQPRIVGVVKDFHFGGPGDGSMATVIRPLEQSPSDYFTLAVQGDEGMKRELGAVLEAVDRTVPVYDVMPFEKRLERALARPNFYTLVLLFFGGFSMLLTLIHGYSVCANTIEQRRRELGIRSALGATTGQLRWMIVRQMGVTVASGLLAGYGISLLAARPLEELVTTVTEVPWQWRVAALCGLAAAGGLSVWWKTRGLLRMTPADTLRSD